MSVLPLYVRTPNPHVKTNFFFFPMCHKMLSAEKENTNKSNISPFPAYMYVPKLTFFILSLGRTTLAKTCFTKGGKLYVINLNI